MFPIHTIHATWITLKHHGQMFSLNLWNTTFSQFNRRGLYLITLIFSHQMKPWGLGVMPLYVVVEYGSIYLTNNAF